KFVESEALNPTHLDSGKPGAADLHALVEVLEVHGDRQPSMGQVFADRGIALMEGDDLARKALDGPLAARTSQVVDVREVPRTRQRKAESVGDGLSLAQVRIGEAARGPLDGLVVVLRDGPRHGQTSNKSEQHRSALRRSIHRAV